MYYIFQTFKSALSVLNPSPIDTCPLFLNTATLAAISNNRSRHNSSAQPHMLTKLISSNSAGYDECIVVGEQYLYSIQVEYIRW